MTTTTNLAEFGRRELTEVRDLLSAMIEHGLPKNFYDNEVHPMFNKMSGYVFLTNSEYEVCMVVDGKLEMFYSFPLMRVKKGSSLTFLKNMQTYMSRIKSGSVRFLKTKVVAMSCQT